MVRVCCLTQILLNTAHNGLVSKISHHKSFPEEYQLVVATLEHTN